MTLVFKASNQGTLHEVQVGPVDVIATVAAANSAWGWVGGLAGVKEILAYGRRFSSGKKGASSFSDPNISAISCDILTWSGVAKIQGGDGSEAFGGDHSSQMLGLTLCALDYLMTKRAVLDLFKTYLAPGLLRREVGPINVLRDALHTQLVDNYDSIINEGAARGLTDRFYKAIAALGLTRTSDNHSRSKGWGQSGDKWPSERYLLGGFVKWLGSGAEGQYPTRSAAVARLAACLREVGYNIATIESWNGVGSKPAFRGVLLVAGGVSGTDPLMDKGDRQTGFLFVSHYYFATTGAMLLNALQTRCETPPEVFQQYFEDIDAKVRRQFTCKWKYHHVPPGTEGDSTLTSYLHAEPQWIFPQRRCSRIAVRLAAFHFRQSAEILAQFYEDHRIDNEAVLSVVKQTGEDCPIGEDLRDELIRFRFITASICLSIIGSVAGQNFNSLQHTTTMTFRHRNAVEKISGEVDKLASSGLPFANVVVQIADIHCATKHYNREKTTPEDEDTFVESSSIIGCRHGAFAVLPELLFSMSSPISVSMLGLRCVDSFIGNLPVQKDRFIRSYRCQAINERDCNLDILNSLSQARGDDGGEAQTALQVDNNIFFGSPALRPPDVPLYLSIERFADFDEPLLGLCGRIKGEAIGNVGVPIILNNIYFSLQTLKEAPPCPGASVTHLAPSQKVVPGMLNVPPSVWGCAPNGKPLGDKNVHTYIPVQGDSAWAIFIAGEYYCRISFGCALCAATGASLDPVIRSRGENPKMVIIGYS